MRAAGNGSPVVLEDCTGATDQQWTVNATSGTIAEGTSGSGLEGAPSAAKLENLIEQGESRLGKAIVETAEKGLQPTGTGNDGATERR